LWTIAGLTGDFSETLLIFIKLLLSAYMQPAIWRKQTLKTPHRIGIETLGTLV